jgi:hypothetical protein
MSSAGCSGMEKNKWFYYIILKEGNSDTTKKKSSIERKTVFSGLPEHFNCQNSYFYTLSFRRLPWLCFVFLDRSKAYQLDHTTSIHTQNVNNDFALRLLLGKTRCRNAARALCLSLARISCYLSMPALWSNDMTVRCTEWHTRNMLTTCVCVRETVCVWVLTYDCASRAETKQSSKCGVGVIFQNVTRVLL